jgi:SPX domain protein involved in polyphosphate accumulation
MLDTMCLNCRISLDGNLWLHDEFGYMSSFEDSVRTSLDPNTGRSILFPHGVLEIKLAGEAPPPWIDELLNDFQSSTVQVCVHPFICF